MSIIEAHGICKTFRIPDTRRDTVREHVLSVFRPRRYRNLRALWNVDLQINQGESFGIMGPNGSGKTTLLKTLCGIYVPDQGQIVIKAPTTHILSLGLGWSPELNAIDNILLIGTTNGLGLPQARSAIDQILDFAGLTHFAELKVKHFSSGMAARLSYAVAFHTVREVLILDEVLAVGDAAFQARCEARLLELQNAGHTIVLVSHSPEQIERFCSKGILLEQGKVMVKDEARTVARAYANFLGSGELSQLNGETHAPRSALGKETTPRRRRAFILGAQKSGTSALYHYLSHHPQVVQPICKDIGYFDQDIVYKRGIDWYDKQFPTNHIDADALFLDATPENLYYPNAPKRIAALSPNARHVVLLREPVSRAYSAWRMLRMLCKERPDYVHALLKDSDPQLRAFFENILGADPFPGFSECIEKELDSLKRGNAVLEPGYVQRGLYVQQLQRCFRYFSKEAVLIVGTDELSKDSHSVVRRVAQFCDLQPFDWNTVETPPINVGSPSESMDAHTEQRLRDFFRPYNQALFDLVGMDLGWG